MILKLKTGMHTLACTTCYAKGEATWREDIIRTISSKCLATIKYKYTPPMWRGLQAILVGTFKRNTRRAGIPSRCYLRKLMCFEGRAPADEGIMYSKC